MFLLSEGDKISIFRVFLNEMFLKLKKITVSEFESVLLQF